MRRRRHLLIAHHDPKPVVLADRVGLSDGLADGRLNSLEIYAVSRKLDLPAFAASEKVEPSFIALAKVTR